MKAGLWVDKLGEADLLLLLATLVGDDRARHLDIVIDKGRVANGLLDVAAVGVDGGRHC